VRSATRRIEGASAWRLRASILAIVRHKTKVRSRRAGLAALVLVLAACDPVVRLGDDADVPAPDADPQAPDGGPDAGPPPACSADPTCGPAVVVSSKAEIAALVGECATWSEAEIDRFRARTGTLKAGAPLFLCPEDFVVPAACQGSDPPCASQVILEVDPFLASAASTAACNGVQIDTGVSFRLAYRLQGSLPGFPMRSARIVFERPCTATCRDSERRCEDNDACYAAGDLCFQCGLGTRAECACRTPELATKPDCTSCSMLFGDFIKFGACKAGLCTTPDEDESICKTCPDTSACP
jgi:hypothetical protein